MLKNYFSGIWKDRYILWNLVNKDLQLKYRRSALGVAWSILTPLGLVLIIGCVYSIIFATKPQEFIPLLFAGLNPWLFISGCAEGGALAFLSAEGYLKQTTVNAQIFPIRGVLVGFVNLLYSILAFFTIYLFLQPDSFGIKMLMIFPGLVIIFVFALAWANISAVINLNIRDYQPLLSLILQGLFYATPIIFPADMLQEKGFGIIYQINPIYYMLEVVRRPMLGNELPDVKMYIIATLIALGMFIASVILVMKQKKNITFKL